MKPPIAPPERTYLEFIREQARILANKRGGPPGTEEAWQKRLKAVAVGLDTSFGSKPPQPCPLDPEVLGTLERDGYVIERLTFQSRPGVRVTANLYRPEPVKGPCPAVLSVHGHWAWARIDPHVQARNIGLVKRGYVVLALDAFGAGERAIEPKAGTYHGGLDGAMLWPVGVPLLGLQVYDNRRAVDYLVSRPEVDPKKLAITGASGGGNQTLYAGATDDRLAAVVPVCGIGTYESYIGTACCVCEMNAGGLTYANTGDLLAMVAPRALLVINATKDAVQFSVAEAAKSVEHARSRFQALGVLDKIRHLPIDSGHDYNKPMREALYGWLDRWLLGTGDGSPVLEPEITTEDPQGLRCYPDGPSRPKTIVTIPQFALNEGQARLAALPTVPDHPQRWEADAAFIRSILIDLEGGQPEPEAVPTARGAEWTVRPEGGLALRGRLVRDPARNAAGPYTLLLRYPGEARADEPVVAALRGKGRAVLTVDLRATGRGKPESGAIAGAVDHYEAEWGLWIGRPLLGQWVRDALTWIDAIGRLAPEGTPIEVVGVGPFGLVGLIAAGLRPGRITRVGLIDGLVSLVGRDTTPWSGLPMGLLAPGLLKTADVGRLAALSAPARLVVAGGVEPSGEAAIPARLASGFDFARAIYRLLGVRERLVLLDSADLDTFARSFAAG
jgi:dienelactone hydrolase